MVQNFFGPKLLRTDNYKNTTSSKMVPYSKTCLRVVPGQDDGQILKQENVASTITGLEPCRFLSIGLS